MRAPGRRAVRVLPASPVLLVVLAVALAFGAAVPAAGAGPTTAAVLVRPAQTEAPASEVPPPRAHLVVNADTGEILFGEHVHEPVPPASTVKIMTALTAIERLPLDATITVSELAASQPATRINMVAGQEWRFDDALASLIMASANDAAYAIAETVGGSLGGFAAAMTATGKRLGMSDSTFADPAGLDDEASFRGGPRMSAFDVAIAIRNALAVPEIARYAAARTHEFVDPAGATRALTNHNKLLPGNSRAYDGATGFKTGYTSQAGHTLAATAEREGCTLIVVVMNTYDTYGWAAALLDRGFAMGCTGGTGERLPAVAVSPYAQRLADQEAFLALARGPEPPTTTFPAIPHADLPRAPVPAGGQAGAAVGDDGLSGTSTGDPDAPTGAGAEGGEAGGEASDSAGWTGVLTTRNVGLAAFGLALVLVALRRRAVKRRRARRLALRRLRAAQMRSGSLPVVEGRYRPGIRVGPPPDSHVRVARRDN